MVKKRKRHDLVLEKFQKTWKEWNEGRIKQFDLIHKTLCLKNESRAYISNVDEATLEYYQAFAKQTKILPPLLGFHHQKNDELLFVTVGTCLTTYSLYKYLK